MIVRRAVARLPAASAATTMTRVLMLGCERRRARILRRARAESTRRSVRPAPLRTMSLAVFSRTPAIVDEALAAHASAREEHWNGIRR